MHEFLLGCIFSNYYQRIAIITFEFSQQLIIIFVIFVETHNNQIRRRLPPSKTNPKLLDIENYSFYSFIKERLSRIVSSYSPIRRKRWYERFSLPFPSYDAHSKPRYRDRETHHTEGKLLSQNKHRIPENYIYVRSHTIINCK